MKTKKKTPRLLTKGTHFFRFKIVQFATHQTHCHQRSQGTLAQCRDAPWLHRWWPTPPRNIVLPGIVETILPV